VTNTKANVYLATLARNLGWTVFDAPRVSSSGLPYLKEMYRHASQHFNSCTFYGYSNGDILYNMDLVVTLKAISKVQYRTLATLIAEISQQFNAFTTITMCK